MKEPGKGRQQHQCCDEVLSDAILKGHADVANSSEREL